MSGNVCKFWLRGNCRYGDKCWYDHPTGGRSQSYYDDYNNDGYSNNYGDRQQARHGDNRNRYGSLAGDHSDDRVVFRNDKNSSNRNQFGASKVHNQSFGSEDFHGEMIKQIRDDLAMWEKGNQWPFTCMAFISEGYNFNMPGFKDYSTEELRWNAYQAEQNDVLKIYKEEVNNLKYYVNLRRQELNKITVQELKMLLANIPSQFDAGGIQQLNENLFQKDLFSGNDKVKQAVDGFSFRLPSVNQQQPNNVLPSSTFGSGCVFGNSNPVLDANVRNSSGFNVGTFGNDQPTFNRQMQSNVMHTINLESPAPKSFTFAAEASIDVPSTQLNNVSAEITLNSNVNPYSNMNDLSDIQKEQFYKPTFTVGLIPTTPPPKELCQ